MNYLQSMLQVLGQCVMQLVQKEPVTFGITLLAGIILAALCWWAATHYSSLFNRTFQITTLHQVLCAGAALLTLIFCVLFVSLRFTRQIAQQAIDAWYQTVGADSFRDQAFIRTYFAVKATGQEDFRNFPPPPAGSVIPLNQPSSKRLVASVPANQALHVFQNANPYLSHVLSLPARMPEGLIVNDVNAFFARTPHQFYPFFRAVNLTASAIKSRVDPETPKAVLYARVILTACFILAQAIPFLWIGFAAYRDLKVGV